MSHGSSDKCEPNFTPLLDLVLQLVMFFMLCANFVMDQTSVEIKLPEALSAKALEPTDRKVFYLNVNEKGEVVFPPGAGEKDSAGNDLLVANPDQLRVLMFRRAKEDKEHIQRTEGREVKPDEQLRTLVILRVHKECRFEDTYKVMQACRTAGYVRVQMRAILGTGN
jgi:biopolymer transport protein ExbD